MIIYTDGSTRPCNPGPGGFGVVVLDDNENLIFTYSEHEDYTTNNRQELKAILWAFLKYGCADGPYENIPIIYTDSAYCMNTFTSWMFNWADNGWVKADGKTPENLDLIQPFYKHWQNGYRVKIKKVKGHSKNKWNEMADKLAAGEYNE